MWHHFDPTLILLYMRWSCRYQLSDRDLEEMMRERGRSAEVSRPELFLATRPEFLVIEDGC